MLLAKHLYLSIMLWYNHILITAALFDYWCLGATFSTKLQSLQNRAAKVILGTSMVNRKPP